MLGTSEFGGNSMDEVGDYIERLKIRYRCDAAICELIHLIEMVREQSPRKVPDFDWKAFSELRSSSDY
jgi:hypothetical protein